MKQKHHKTTEKNGGVYYYTIELFRACCDVFDFCTVQYHHPSPQPSPSFPSSFVANHPASEATQILAEHLDIPTNMGLSIASKQTLQQYSCSRTSQPWQNDQRMTRVTFWSQQLRSRMDETCCGTRYSTVGCSLHR